MAYQDPKDSNNTNAPSTTINAQELFDVVNSNREAIKVSEDELKRGDTKRNPECMFVSDAMLRAFSQLPKEVQERYRWYGDQYYSKVIDQITKNSIEMEAYKVLAAVKSGLNPGDLSTDELSVLKNVYGDEWYLNANLTAEDVKNIK